MVIPHRFKFSTVDILVTLFNQFKTFYRSSCSVWQSFSFEFFSLTIDISKGSYISTLQLLIDI